MARREITQFFDDLDNTPLGADDVNVVEFSYAGADYVVDLSEDNALKLASTLEPFIKVATKVARNRGGKARAASTSKSDPSRTRRIRDWARDNGHSVSARGQISHEIITAYEEANPSDN